MVLVFYVVLSLKLYKSSHIVILYSEAWAEQCEFWRNAVILWLLLFPGGGEL